MLLKSILTKDSASSCFHMSTKKYLIKKFNFNIFIYLLKNDLVTAVFMYLIATQHNKIDKTKIDSLYLDEWFIQYIGILIFL